MGDKLDKDAQKKEVSVDKMESGWIGLDIGNKSIAEYERVLNSANTIFWNGPMGVFEVSGFEKGTQAIAKSIAERESAIKVIGGGDTISAVRKFGYTSKVTHISTGGGASLEFLGGRKLPGVEALR
jgi:phosphoglycerate kinase